MYTLYPNTNYPMYTLLTFAIMHVHHRGSYAALNEYLLPVCGLEGTGPPRRAAARVRSHN